MNYFDSEAFIKELESMQDVEEKPFDFEDFEEYEIMTERDLKNDL
jgi:DNA replication initiation complex subunit (GINS family)